MHVPVLMYRQRFTVVARRADKPTEPVVSWKRNVASFDFTHDGMEFVVVIASVGGRPTNAKTVPVDLYRQDPETGQWNLVGLDGRPVAGDWTKAPPYTT